MGGKLSSMQPKFKVNRAVHRSSVNTQGVYCTFVAHNCTVGAVRQMQILIITIGV